jgi:hypothetical protein
MILRWQYQSFRNTVRAAFTNRPLETVFVAVGALLVIAFNAADAYALVVDAGPMLRGQWPRVVIAGLAASAVLGGTIGFSLGRWASARARALWIAVLPWPDAAKKRSARSAALTHVAALGSVALALGWISSAALGQPNAFLWGAAASAAFLIPAGVAAVIGAGDADHSDEPPDIALAPARPSWIGKLAAALDRSSPRWVGVWAQTDNSPYVSAWWIGSLVICGGAAGAISIAQWQPWPSVVMSAIGGNLAFMVGLNAQPLLSPVLRSTSIGYAEVWMALIRLPAVLSLAWFGLAALPALLVSRHFGGEAAGFIPVLTLLNILFSASVALNPSSRSRATFLYVILLAVILYQGLQYGMAYGVLDVVVMLGAGALLWSGARRRFRLNG